MTTPNIPETLRAKLTSDRLERSLVISREMIDQETRTVTLAFASETPVMRYFGVEVLECTPAAMRQERLKSGANLLMEHQRDDVVGVVESATVDADRVCRAVVRFGKSARAEEIYQDVLDGIRTNVSVGYLIHRAIIEENKQTEDVYRIVDWEPLEISLVSIPADASVGVGRNLDTTTNPLPSERNIMEPKTTEPTTTNAPAAAPVVQVTEPINHARNITEIAGDNPILRDLAFSFIQSGKSTDEFQRAAIEKLATAPVKTAEVGMTDKEVRSYSILRMINAMANPADAKAQSAAAFEFECSRAVSDIAKKPAQGAFVPYDVLSKRDLTKGNATSAGNLVAKELMSGDFIELLRDRMVVAGLGIRFLSGLTSDIDFPRLIESGSAYWVGEQVAPAKSDQKTDRISMTPKTVGARTIISRKLRQQSSISVENMVMDDLNQVLALEMQRAIINGAGGADQPLGLLNIPGIFELVATGAITWKDCVGLETNVSVLNADVGSLAYLTNALVRGALKTTERFSTTNGQSIWVDGETPVNGYKAAVTNAVPSNGEGSSMIYGNWNDVYVGMWGGLDVLVDPYTGGAQGDVGIRLLQDMDVALRHKESFAVRRNITTA